MITAPTEFSGLQVWLDASDTTRLFQLSGGTTAVAANLDPVGYWGDKSGNNRHFTNIGGSATTRPTWVSSLSSLRFDGSNDYLTLSATQTYTAQTTFIVTSPRAFAANTRMFSQAAAGVDDTFYSPIYQSGASSTGLLASLASNANASQGVSLRSLNTFDVITSWHSGTTIRNFRNGESAPTSSHTLGTLTVLRQRLGANITNTGVAAANYYSSDISEVIVYNRALTNLERADVEYYLTRKWNFLNSIPRQVYGIKNSLWSLTDTWSVSAEPSPWNFPLSADNAYTNTFTITADSSTRTGTIRNSLLAPNIVAGGSFVLANGVSLSANVLAGVGPYTLTLNPAATAILVGNTTGSTAAGFASTQINSTSMLTLVGSVYAGTSVVAAPGGPGLQSLGNSIIYGNIASGSSNYGGTGMYSLSGANTTLYGDLVSIAGPGAGLNNALGSTARIYGSIGTVGNTGNASANNKYTLDNSGLAYVVGDVHGIYGPYVSGAIANRTTGVAFITGNIFAGRNDSQSNSYGIHNFGNGPVNIVGNVITPNASNTTPCIYNASTGTIAVSGAVITFATAAAINNASTGTVMISGGPITASSLGAALVSTSTSAVSRVYTNIINAPNGRQAIYAPKYQVFPTGSAQYTRQASNGYDSYVDYWTSDATFTYPASSDVASGISYSNNTLNGSMAVPSASSVALGALVGISTGTASITIDNVLSQPIANLTTSNSIGARLKNITTSQALSSIANSLNFTN